MQARPVPAGIRITKVGLWYILLTVVVGVAAANSGNNSLYLVEAVLLAVLVVSGLASRGNLRNLQLEAVPPDEVHAGQRFSLRLQVTNRSRLFGRRLVVIRSGAKGPPAFIGLLRRRERRRARLEIFASRRGALRLPCLQVSSIFPLGLFRKGLRYRTDLEVIIFPEISPLALRQHGRSGGHSDRSSQRRGWGHELLSLRDFRPGDDYRDVHWKRSARTGTLVVMEREAEKDRRLSILLDNGVGEPSSPVELMRFERLVSEAASAAHYHLEQGFEVELVTRGGGTGFARSRRHRLRIMEILALVDPVEVAGTPLRGSDGRAAELRLTMAPEVEAAV